MNAIEGSITPDGKRLVTMEPGGRLRVWDLEGLADPPIERRGLPIKPKKLIFSLDSRLERLTVALRTNGGVGWLGSEPEGRSPQEFRHTWGLRRLRRLDPSHPSCASRAFSALAAATGSDGLTRVWSLSGAEADPIRLLPLPGRASASSSDQVYDKVHVAFSHDDRWVATAGLDAVVRVWDLVDRNATPIEFHGCDSDVSAVAFRPGYRQLVATTGG
jgi:WD40 repeat protein